MSRLWGDLYRYIGQVEMSNQANQSVHQTLDIHRLQEFLAAGLRGELIVFALEI